MTVTRGWRERGWEINTLLSRKTTKWDACSSRTPQGSWVTAAEADDKSLSSPVWHPPSQSLPGRTLLSAWLCKRRIHFNWLSSSREPKKKQTSPTSHHKSSLAYRCLVPFWNVLCLVVVCQGSYMTDMKCCWQWLKRVPTVCGQWWDWKGQIYWPENSRNW